MSNYIELREKFDETWQRHHELNTELERLKIAMHDEALKEVLKDKLLSSVEWRLARRGFRGAVSIEGDTRRIKDKAAYAQLEKMFHTDYHCQTQLSFNARLRWDDGELTINFDSFDNLRSFCKEYGFKINTDTLHEDINKSLEEIISLTKKVEQYREYVKEIEVNV